MRLNIGAIRGEIQTVGFPGPPGPDGLTPQFKHVITNSIPADQPANVTITGPTEDLTIIFDIPEGLQGEVGDTGNGIDRIELTKSEGLVDTYTIYYTNGNTFEFKIINGGDETGAPPIQRIFLNGKELPPENHIVNINSAVGLQNGQTILPVNESGMISLNDLVFNCGTSEGVE